MTGTETEPDQQPTPQPPPVRDVLADPNVTSPSPASNPGAWAERIRSQIRHAPHLKERPRP